MPVGPIPNGHQLLSCSFLSVLPLLLRWCSWGISLSEMQLHVKLAYGHDIWIENGMTGFSDLRRQKKQGFRRDVSLPRQLPSTPCSPNRPVLAKTSVIAEKNTAKKLTLGAWRQHSVIFTFLWSYFQALKSTPKIPHTQLWLEIFFFVSWERIWGWDGLKLTCLPHPCLYLCFPLCYTASLK